MSTATDMLAHYLAAEAAVLSGQVYKWGDRQLSRADLSQIIAGRKEWQRNVQAEQRGGIGVRLANFHGIGGPENTERYCWGINR